jgi:hypothetical protein
MYIWSIVLANLVHFVDHTSFTAGLYGHLPQMLEQMSHTYVCKTIVLQALLPFIVVSSNRTYIINHYSGIRFRFLYVNLLWTLLNFLASTNAPLL